ncbi:MAG: DHA2 family efflux MFS transporter permease subunit [Solirubrobacteraceae bacterium]|nr:DHA2 family efflux MFS transporter permease subunit [Solirubrobacteraceae bacterium]
MNEPTRSNEAPIAAGVASPGATDPRRRAKVAALVSTGVFMASLDLFIVNVAFPDIAASFSGSSLGGLSWVLNAYAIVFAAALVPAGRWFDRVGRRRGFLGGVALFGVASAVCAAAPSLEVLVAARVLQAVGAAMLLPTSLGLLLPEYAPEQRAGAVALWSAVGGVAAAAGPPIGGLLVELSWRWVFLVNVPIALAAVLIGRSLLVERRDPHPGPTPDLLGAGVLAGAVALLTWGIVEAPDHGWLGARTLVGAAAALVLAAAFIARSRHHAAPVVPPEIIRRRAFAFSTSASLLFYVAFSAMLLNGVLVLSGVWGYSTLETGFGLVPGPAMAALVASRGGGLGARFGQRNVAALGALVFAIGGFIPFTQLTDDPAYVTAFLPGMLVGGFGVGLVLPSMAGAAFGGLPPALMSTGIAVFSVARQVGSALGVALLVAVLGDLAGGGAEAAKHGYLLQVGVALAAGLVALGIRTEPVAASAISPADAELERELEAEEFAPVPVALPAELRA